MSSISESEGCSNSYGLAQAASASASGSNTVSAETLTDAAQVIFDILRNQQADSTKQKEQLTELKSNVENLREDLASQKEEFENQRKQFAELFDRFKPRQAQTSGLVEITGPTVSVDPKSISEEARGEEPRESMSQIRESMEQWMTEVSIDVPLKDSNCIVLICFMSRKTKAAMEEFGKALAGVSGDVLSLKDPKCIVPICFVSCSFAAYGGSQSHSETKHT